MTALEHRIPPPLVMMVMAAMMAMAHYDPYLLPLPTLYRWILAGICFIAAGIFGFPAFKAFAKARTTINPVAIDQASTLVTSGVYRVTRNPMYVGLTLLLCAWAFIIGHLSAVIGPTAFVLFINRFQIVPEERVLTAKFGGDYLDYRRSVRRWL